MESLKGGLYLVSTPIGNLGDISGRALDVLRHSHLVLAEDTRRTGILFKHYDVKPPMTSFHDHNEDRKLPGIMEALRRGQVISLVSDAGTPLLSDPGYKLVVECRRENIPVQVVPGPSSILTALVLSGFPVCPFSFVGYPPRKKGKRSAFWADWTRITHSVVFFSTPHAILRHLEELVEHCPDRELFIGREMTKMHEEHLIGTPVSLLEILKERPRIRGEITCVLAPA